MIIKQCSGVLVQLLHIPDPEQKPVSWDWGLIWCHHGQGQHSTVQYHHQYHQYHQYHCSYQCIKQLWWREHLMRRRTLSWQLILTKMWGREMWHGDLTDPWQLVISSGAVLISGAHYNSSSWTVSCKIEKWWRKMRQLEKYNEHHQSAFTGTCIHQFNKLNISPQSSYIFNIDFLFNIQLSSRVSPHKDRRK